MSKGIFGSMFDFNRDGKLDAIERAAEFQFFNDVVLKERESDTEDEGRGKEENP